MANVLYLESPRGVGYSYQDFSENSDTGYDDDKVSRGQCLKEHLPIRHCRTAFGLAILSF